MFPCDAIIIGGGAAGIAAARELQKAGLQRVIILEARARLGGRVHTSDELGCGAPLDKGAQWIHGYSPAHPMVKLADSLDKAHAPMAGGFNTTVLSDGRALSGTASAKAQKSFSDLRKHVNCEGCQAAEDSSWADVFERLNDVEKLSPEEQAALNLRIFNSCENYEGARLDRWSTKSWNKVTCLRGGNGDVSGGYGGLIVEAACGLLVHFNRRVESVVYSVESETGQDVPHVVVSCQNTDAEGDARETYYAPRCVVTLPLGVLRAGRVKFHPELPRDKVKAINTLGISVMDKVELLWHRRWWPKSMGSFEIASLASTLTFHPWPWFYEPAAMRTHPLGWSALVCYITGQFAEFVESLSDADAVAQCMAALRSAFPSEDIAEPTEAHITRWARDEFAHGCWTYYAVGSGPDDVHALRQPVGLRGCVAFAGEHTCDGSVPGLDMGTVHGAWLSGELAAKGLMQHGMAKQYTGDLASLKLRTGKWRCSHRHLTDKVIPEIEGYHCGAVVVVTERESDVAEEFCADPDEALHIAKAQQYCGKRGTITGRSQWGWLKVEFEDCSAPCWWTPYCLWIVDC